jgi:hypothetical protein
LQLEVRPEIFEFNNLTPHICTWKRNANRANDSEQQQQHRSSMHMARKDAIVEPEKEAESSPLPSKTWHPPEKEAQISALPSHADPADAGRSSSLPVPAEPRTGE